MLNGYATIPNALGLPPKIGEARHVFGKKNAKEEIAKGVWEALEALAIERNVTIDHKKDDYVG